MAKRDELHDIKAVSFDGDMTLWDFEEATRRALGVVLDELRRCVNSKAAGELTVAKMIEIRDQVAAEMRDETYELGVIRLEAFKRRLDIGIRPALSHHLDISLVFLLRLCK